MTKKRTTKLDDRLISITEAMDMLGLSRCVVQGLCRDGWIEGAYPLTMGWAVPLRGVIAYRDSERYQSRERWRRAASTTKAKRASTRSE